MKDKDLRKLLYTMLFAVYIFSFTPLIVQAVSKSAKEAYRSYLQSPQAEKDSMGWYTPQFGLIDLNKDGVSELIVTGDGMYRFNMYAYVNGKVTFIGSGYSGDYAFYPNKKLIYMSRVHGGDATYTYYKFDGERMNKIAAKAGCDYMNLVTGERKNYDEQGSAYTYAPYVYEIKSQSVTASKYKAYVQKLKKNAKKKKLKLIDITNANFEKYL